MPGSRPSIPADLERRVLIEAGHRCAIPACRSTPVELAHIVPWAKVKEHKFENLIALCPTCHSRFDRGEIDRKAMLLYKQNLRRSDYVTRVLRRERLDTYIDLMRTLDRWGAAIRKIEAVDVDSFSPPAKREELVKQCCAVAAGVNELLVRFNLVHESEVSFKADEIYGWYLSLANDVVDGLWPSTHLGATPHDAFECYEVETALRTAVANEVALTVDQLEAIVEGESPRLGGTGKRF